MYDVLIKNGMIVDGTRKKAYAANLYLQGDKIAEISTEEKPAAKVFDAAGHIVAPGFIDLHCHSDRSYRKAPAMNTMLANGITFEFCGQCGNSAIPTPTVEEGIPYDFTTYMEDVQAKGCSINMGTLIGHGALRKAVIGVDMRDPSDEEMQQMCDLLDKLLTQGAAGISFGLIYAPGSLCKTEEIDALARVVAKHDKLLAVHMRNENLKVFEAIEEMIGVAKRSGCKLEISHLKLMGTQMWGKADELLARIDLARAQGVRIHADQYPYTASHSGLASSFPRWVLDQGYDVFTERMKDDATWAKMIADGLPEMKNRGGAENIIVSEVPEGSECEKYLFKNLPQIAEMQGVSLFDAIRDIMIRCKGNVSCVYRNMNEGDLLKIMSRRDVSVVSDGSAYDPAKVEGHPHPRNAGTATRFLRLARENKLMDVEDAVYKLTGLPASIAGYGERFGFLKPGYDATVTVFDWDTVHDNSTFEEPWLLASGVDFVFVNGELVYDHGTFTEARPGKVLAVASK